MSIWTIIEDVAPMFDGKLGVIITSVSNAVLGVLAVLFAKDTDAHGEPAFGFDEFVITVLIYTLFSLFDQRHLPLYKYFLSQKKQKLFRHYNTRHYS